jgi:hypothetical protein
MDDIEAAVRAVFSGRLFFAPNPALFRDRAEALRALRSALEGAGYRPTLERQAAPLGIGRALLAPPPRYHLDEFDGEHAYAKYVLVEPAAGKPVYVAISFVAPVFTVTDAIYTYNSPRDAYRASWRGGEPDILLNVEPYAEILERARVAFEPLGLRYMPWDSPELDEPVPMEDIREATLRDCLFNYEEYE